MPGKIDEAQWQCRCRQRLACRSKGFQRLTHEERWLERPRLTHYLDSGVIDEVTEVIPSQIDEAMPELPTELAHRSSHHFSVGSWIVVMSFRSEAFSLDFCHIKFWRGCFWFLVKRR